MENQANKRPSDCALVLIILFFPYVLLFRLFKLLVKASKEPPEKANANALVFLLSGAFFFITGIAYVAAGFAGELQSDNQNDIVFGMVVMFLLFCGGGVALMLMSLKYFKLSKLYNKYIPYILSSGVLSIHQLSQILNVSYDTALRDLQLLLTKGALKGAYIEHPSGSIVLPNPPEPPKKKVFCPHCNGANLVYVGQDASCDYCGSPIKG